MPAPTPFFHILRPEQTEPADEARQWLGRIVQHHASPGTAFTPRDPSRLLLDHPTSETELADASLFLRNTANHRLGTQLSGLASLFRHRREAADLQVSTSRIRYLRLHNHAKGLELLRADAEVHEDLARLLRPGGDPAFLIVGMLIWQDAVVVGTQATSFGRGGCLEAPIAPVLAATTGALIPDVAPGITATREVARGRMLSGVAQGSRIFGFEYRCVKRRVYAIGRNFTPRLGQYGRINHDAVFGHAHGGAMAVESEPDVGQGVIAMDEDDESWVDSVDGLDIVEVCGVKIAVGSADEDVTS